MFIRLVPLNGVLWLCGLPIILDPMKKEDSLGLVLTYLLILLLSIPLLFLLCTTYYYATMLWEYDHKGQVDAVYTGRCRIVPDIGMAYIDENNDAKGYYDRWAGSEGVSMAVKQR